MAARRAASHRLMRDGVEPGKGAGDTSGPPVVDEGRNRGHLPIGGPDVRGRFDTTSV
jgi:hypothetical protein